MASRFKFLFLLFAALSFPLEAQHYVVSIDGWPKMGPGPDGKLGAFEFQFLTVPQPTASAKGTVQDFQFTIQNVGDAVARFTKHALEGSVLKTVLFEPNPARNLLVQVPPVVVRLSDVRVTAVKLSLHSFPEALVTLQASKIEMFTPNPTTGAMQPFRWDIKAGKGM